jgi:hypothetical protein
MKRNILNLRGNIFCLLAVVLIAMSGAAWAEKKDYPQSVRNLPPISVIKDGEKRKITLCEVFDYHGNACPGATVGFMAMRYGLELLYAEETPDLDDLIVISHSPGGPLDLFDLFFKGNDRSKRTWPPAGMTPAAGNFVFQFIRKSTMESVEVRLNPDLWPNDWFLLRDKFRSGTITDAEKKKRKQNREYVIQGFPGKSFQELFGDPRVQHVIAWGSIEQGEIDRRIRQQRRQAKTQEDADG